MNRLTVAFIPVVLLMAACQQSTVAPPIEEVIINSSSPDKADIGSMVWFDENRDGIRQSSELGVDDVKVSLWTDTNRDGNPDSFIVSTLTKNGGLYRFNALDPDTAYLLHVDLPANFHFSPKNRPDAPSSSFDSDVDMTGLSDSIDVQAGIFSHTINAGLVDARGELYPRGNVSIGNKVWQDDGDGLKQVPELGFHNLMVNLWLDEDKDGLADKKVAFTRTDLGGYYQFNALSKSAHFLIEVIAPDGYSFSPKHNPEASSRNSDSDINENGFSDVVEFEQGRTFHHWIDAGLKKID